MALRHLALLPLLLAPLVACRDRAPAPDPQPGREAPAPLTAPAPSPLPPIASPSAGSPSVATSSSTGTATEPPPSIPPPRGGDGLLLHVRSAYSNLKVVDIGPRRTLLFVRDNGEEVIESAIDLRAPDLLEIEYTRAMFVSYLFRPRQARCLIVGLGGGSMVRFLNRFFPETAVDAVEIDPVVVKLARDFFGVGAGPRTRIYTEDGFAFLGRAGEAYDAIYMDAFLKPSAETDAEGAPRRLKTEQFLRSLHRRLVPEGMLVVNLNQQAETRSDIAAIRAAFPTAHVFPVPRTGNIIAVGALAQRKPTDAELRANGVELDRRASHGFSFAAMAGLRLP
jgi:spermidine synthase